jgi:hypothetical protein
LKKKCGTNERSETAGKLSHTTLLYCNVSLCCVQLQTWSAENSNVAAINQLRGKCVRLHNTEKKILYKKDTYRVGHSCSINQIEIHDALVTSVEVGSNTSTVTLRVVGGDEMGSRKCETVKYGLKSQGTWQGPAAYTKDRPDLSSERAPHKNKTVTVTHVIKTWS